MGRPVANFEDMATLMRRVAVNPVTGCWEWLGFIQTLGYGQIEIAGRIWLAHRLSWSLHHCDRDAAGRLMFPPALVLHSCDNPPCVNPGHLFLGDHQANTDDAIAKGRFDPFAVSRHSHKKRIRKLSDAQVREIRTARFNDATYARRFGVATTTVCNIRNRKTKTLVPD